MRTARATAKRVLGPRTLLLLGAWTTTQCSCGSEPIEDAWKRSAVIDHADLQPISLTGTLLTGSPAIGEPTILAVDAHFLWVADAAGDPGLHAVDLASGEIVLSIGRRGEGPGEFSMSPFSLQVAPGDSGGVWTFDLGLQRLTRFEPRPLAEYDLKVIKLGGAPRIWRTAWVGPDRIIGQANSEESRFAIFSADGKRISDVSAPLLGPAGAPTSEGLRASNAAIGLCSWPGKGFVVVYSTVGRIEYYDESARLVRRADVPFASDARFEPDSTRRIRFVEDRNWYNGCSANGEHLFALFAGRIPASFSAERKYSGEFVHVFNWNGEFEGAIALDRDLIAIVVDQAARTLFGASVVDASIWKYSLPLGVWP